MAKIFEEKTEATTRQTAPNIPVVIFVEIWNSISFAMFGDNVFMLNGYMWDKMKKKNSSRILCRKENPAWIDKNMTFESNLIFSTVEPWHCFFFSYPMIASFETCDFCVRNFSFHLLFFFLLCFVSSFCTVYKLPHFCQIFHQVLHEMHRMWTARCIQGRADPPGVYQNIVYRYRYYIAKIEAGIQFNIS